MDVLLGFALLLVSGICVYLVWRGRLLQEQLFRLQNHNPVSGLPNQHFLTHRIATQVSAEGDSINLLYFELENYRDISHVFGQDFGHRLVNDFALRLRFFLPPKALLCHLTTDRFCLLFPDPMQTEEIERLCSTIRESMNVPFKVLGYTVRLRLIFGHGLYRPQTGGFEKFLLQLEQMVREQGPKAPQKTLLFTEASGVEQNLRIRLKNDLKAAVESGQFIPYFQPIVNLETGQVEKAEMLIRWRHPELGFVRPGDFIPLAEQTGSILQIGQWCRMQAIQHASHWCRALNRAIQISINMSPIELMDDGPDSSVQAFIQATESAGLPTDRFVFEITEGALVLDDPVSEGKINDILKGGIDLSIDDFGTGFSSISYLNRFPINFIKLDISFVRHLADDPSQQVVCDHIIRLAHALDIRVVAEGIETAAQADILQGMGCDYGQGYLYSQPIAAAEFEQRFLGTETDQPA